MLGILEPARFGILVGKVWSIGIGKGRNGEIGKINRGMGFLIKNGRMGTGKVGQWYTKVRFRYWFRKAVWFG